MLQLTLLSVTAVAGETVMLVVTVGTEARVHKEYPHRTEVRRKEEEKLHNTFYTTYIISQ